MNHWHVRDQTKLTSRCVSSHDVDYALTLTGRELGQRVRHGRHTGPPVLLWTVTLHRAQTLSSDSIKLPFHRQQLQVGPVGKSTTYVNHGVLMSAAG